MDLIRHLTFEEGIYHAKKTILKILSKNNNIDLDNKADINQMREFLDESLNCLNSIIKSSCFPIIIPKNYPNYEELFDKFGGYKNLDELKESENKISLFRKALTSLLNEPEKVYEDEKIKKIILEGCNKIEEAYPFCEEYSFFNYQ